MANTLRVAPFRWAVGGLCAFIGALMLVEPQQFEAAVYAPIRSSLEIFGAGFIAAGAALLCVAATAPRTVVTFGVHALAGGVLVLLASGFVNSAAWTGVAIWGVLGVATILAAIQPVLGNNSRARGDLLALVTGMSGLLIGLLMLFAPSQFGASTYDPIRTALAGYGVAFVVTSVGLLAVELVPFPGHAIKRTAHLLAGALFMLFMMKVAWPTPTGVALYGGFGLAVALQPWLANRLPQVDAYSLRSRAALILIAVGALPLIAAVAFVADQAEQSARQQALAQQQTLAVALAADADDYIGLHRAAIAGLATIPGFLDLGADEKHALLRQFSAGYPDVVAFSIFDVDGNPLGRSDELQASASTGFPVYEDARRLNAPSLDILISTLIHQPIFAFGSPIRDARGQFAGLVLVTLESTRLAEQVTAASGGKDMLTYLVDGRGRVIAHPDARLVASFANMSDTPPVSAFLSAGTPTGTVAYSTPDGERLVGYAVTQLGWGVIVERPTAIALASVRRARELAFDALLACIALAVIVAYFATRWLTRPLAVLADAAQRHSTGDHTAPLPSSRLTEIARLASAFRLMREQVVSRTAERDHASAELRESEGRLRQLMDGVPVGIFVVDAAGQPYYANREAIHLLGRGIVPNTGISGIAEAYQVYRVGTEQLYPAGEVPVVRALDGESVAVDDIEIRRPDGEAVLVDVRASPIRDENGRVEFAMAAFTDISERKRFEVQLRVARDQALEASKAKSAFLATMSHEIRTPMNAVIGLSGLLMDTELTARQFEYADAVRRSGEALLAIINDILDFSKIEAGKLEIDFAVVNVREAVEDVLELLAEQAHSRGLELAARMDPGLPLGLLGDAGRIRQVLMNLVGNAVKFTERGEVVVRVELVEHTSATAVVRFEVSDTGIGISQDVAGHLFQPFSQADSSTTRKYGGTGLGLAICKGLVERMGGTIGVETEPGRGSTFWFTVCLTGTASASPMRAAVADLGGMRLLAVDDNATNRLILREQLSTAGVSVTMAEDAPLALEMLREAAADGRPFRIAVLDMHMPGMDGLQLARAIRSDAAIAATRLVLLTSVGEHSDADLFAAVLTKPARQSQLLATLTSLLQITAPTGSVPRPVRAEPIAVDRRESNGPLVLVAEDTSFNQLVARRMLESLGCRVDVVANGSAAVTATDSIVYAAVMMDCRMPVMDGFEATTAIRQREAANGQQRMPIIAMTADALQGDRERCLAVGMDDYVSKPVRMHELEIVVRRWVRFADGKTAAA